MIHTWKVELRPDLEERYVEFSDMVLPEQYCLFLNPKSNIFFSNRKVSSIAIPYRRRIP